MYYGLLQLGFSDTDFTLQDDSDGNSDKAQPSSSELQIGQDAYDALEYSRTRKKEYDKLNQFEMQFDDQRDGTSIWVDTINSIKVEYPKP